MIVFISKNQILFYISALNDAGSQEGVDNILNTFTFYEDKIKAATILETVDNRTYKFKCYLKIIIDRLLQDTV